MSLTTLTVAEIAARLRAGHTRGCDTAEGGSCTCGFEDFLYECAFAYLDMRRAAELRDEIARA